MKNKLIGILVIFLLLTFNLTHVNSKVISTLKENEGDGYPEECDIYYDVDVFVFGRCTTKGYVYTYDKPDETWENRLYIGYLICSIIQMYEPPEWLFVLIRNESIAVKYLEFGDTNFGVDCHNASGIFYWGAKDSGYSPIPPRVFIKCHAEKVEVYQNWSAIDE